MILAVSSDGSIWRTDNSGGESVKVTVRLDRVELAAQATLCDSAGAGLRMWNDHCDQVEIISAGFEDPNSPLVTSGALTIDTIPPPGRILATDGVDTIGIRWKPHLIAEKDTSYTTRIRIRYRSGTTNEEYDTTITLRLGALRGKTNYRLSTRNVSLPATSMCGYLDSMITLRNFGCDTLHITSGSLSNVIDYQLLGSLTNIPIPPGSEITIPFRFIPQSPGALSSRLTLFLWYEGQTIEDIIFLEGTGTEGDGKLSYEPKAFDFNTLSICGRDSGSGFVTNTGCKNVSLDLSEVFSGGDYSMPILSALPIPPGDTIRYKVYLNPQQKGIRTGYVILTSTNRSGARRDSIPLTVIVTDGTRILSSSLNALDFGTTTLCQERDSMITLRNTGCDTLVITSADVAGIGFRVSGAGFPIVILPGESREITIETQADTTGGAMANTATLIFASNADNSIQPITLTRSFAFAPSYDMSLRMTDAGGTAGEFVKLQLIAGNWWQSDNVMRGVTKMDFDLEMNTDLLDYIAPPTSNNQVNINGSHVTITGSPEITAADGVIAEFLYQVMLTRDSATDIIMRNIVFNQGDASPCKPQPLGGAGAAFAYRYVCGDRTIQRFMRDKAIEIVSIRPNPAKDEVTIEILMSKAPFSRGLGVDPLSEKGASIVVEIYDALGKLVASGNYQLTTTNLLTLVTASWSPGIYVVRVGSVSRSFVVER